MNKAIFCSTGLPEVKSAVAMGVWALTGRAIKYKTIERRMYAVFFIAEAYYSVKGTNLQLKSKFDRHLFSCGIVVAAPLAGMAKNGICLNKNTLHEEAYFLCLVIYPLFLNAKEH
jgi:hypothetical protein